MCDQQRLRSACAYAQSDQSFRLSLEYSMTGKLLTEQNLEFLSLKGGCTGSSESIYVKMPHCWKSRVMAHFCLFIVCNYSIVCLGVRAWYWYYDRALSILSNVALISLRRRRRRESWLLHFDYTYIAFI